MCSTLGEAASGIKICHTAHASNPDSHNTQGENLSWSRKAIGCGPFVRDISRLHRVKTMFSQKVSTFSRSFSAFSGLFGPVFTHLDSFGCFRQKFFVQKKEETLNFDFCEHFREVSQNFHKLFDVFGRFWTFLNAFKPVRIRSDTFGCVRMH